jgi:SAM-dependent methyltransferase
MDIPAFTKAQLPAAPARVLEVGCGQGRLARGLAGSGYRVTAIDPEAPEGPIFRAVSLEEFAGDEQFDAVVANRALHHIHDLRGALAKVERLLVPGGRLLLIEHAWERMDEPTARWYLEHRETDHHHAPPSVEGCRAEWEADHAGLHSYAAMREELDRRFRERLFAWTPYLYGELDAALEAEERALVETGAIQAMGFVYVGERRP